ncbi:MAG: hypothetical protein ACOX50_03270 [Patescibacteria group bacterium]|jgi:hypothetical protein
MSEGRSEVPGIRLIKNQSERLVNNGIRVEVGKALEIRALAYERLDRQYLLQYDRLPQNHLVSCLKSHLATTSPDCRNCPGELKNTYSFIVDAFTNTNRFDRGYFLPEEIPSLRKALGERGYDTEFIKAKSDDDKNVLLFRRDGVEYRFVLGFAGFKQEQEYVARRAEEQRREKDETYYSEYKGPLVEAKGAVNETLNILSPYFKLPENPSEENLFSDPFINHLRSFAKAYEDAINAFYQAKGIQSPDITLSLSDQESI